MTAIPRSDTKESHQKVLQCAVVGDDAVVHHDEGVAVARGVRVAVDRRGPAVRRPSRVPNARLRVQHLRRGGVGFDSGRRMWACIGERLWLLCRTQRLGVKAAWPSCRSAASMCYCTQSCCCAKQHI